MVSVLIGVGREVKAYRQLNFKRRAEIGEIHALKRMYDRSWRNPKLAISKEQLEAKINTFPEGQIVGRLEDGTPVSMINVMVTSWEQKQGFIGGYDKVTGDRTFSTHLKLEEAKRKAKETGGIPIALCVSVVVDQEHQGKDYALETLNYAIGFAEENGLAAVPYSRPSGFSKIKEENPDLDIRTYLHLTRPSKVVHKKHVNRLEELSGKSHRIAMAFPGMLGAHHTEARYNYYQEQEDNPKSRIDETLFAQFLREDAEKNIGLREYGRKLTIEDFCILFGRKMLDPIMNMHIQNGARFIRNQKGEIIAIFENSRPEDVCALGYNIALSYTYKLEFGHTFMASVR